MTTQSRRFLILGVIVAVAALGLGGLYLLRGVQVSRAIAENRAAGLEAYGKGDYQKALPALSFVASRDRQDGDVLYALADARRRVPMENYKHLLTATSMAKAAESAMADPAKARAMLLELYGQLGFYTEQRDVAVKILDRDKKNRRALEALVVSNERTGKRDEAMAAADRLADAFPDDVTVHGVKLQLMQAAGRPASELVDYADRIAAEHPDDPDIMALQSRVAAVANDRPRAVELAKKLVKMEIKRPGSLNDIARQLDLLALSSDADEMLRTQLQRPEFAAAAGQLIADRAWKAGLADEARSALAPLLVDRDKATDDALGLSALIDQTVGAAPGSTPAIDALRARTTTTAQNWCRLIDARAALARNSLDEGRKLLADVLASDPRNEHALFALGSSKLVSGEASQAVDLYRDALRIEPRWLELRLALISTLLDLGRTQDAWTESQRTVLMFPSRLAAILALARTGVLLSESGAATPEQQEATLKVLGQLEGEQVSQGEVLALRARAFASVGRKAEAADTLSTLIEKKLLPSGQTLIDLIPITRRIDRPDLAQALEALAGGAQQNPGLVYTRAQNAALAGRAQEGLAMLRRALEAAPPEHKAGYKRALATFLETQGDPEGLKLLKEMATEHPESITSQVDLLNSERAWTSQDNVRPAIDRIKAVAGENSAVWKIYESRRRLTFERTPAAAAEVSSMLSPVVRDDPQNTTALLTLAEANIVLNDEAAAIDLLGRAADASPQSTRILATLCTMLQQKGDGPGAEARLKDFLRLTDISPEARRQRAKLLLFQGMWPEAEADLNVIAASGEERDALALAQFYQLRGRNDEARKAYDALLARPNPSSTLEAVAADFFERSGDPQRAARLIDQAAAKLTPEQAPLLRAGFDEQHGRPAEAEQTLAKACENPGHPSAFTELASFYVRRNRFDDARAVIARGLAKTPDDEQLKSLAGVLAQSKAEGAGGEVVIPPNAGPELKALIEIQRNAPKPGEDIGPFIEKLRELTQKYPVFFPAHQAYLSACVQTGRAELAVAGAKAAVRALPADARAAQLATEAIEKVGDPAEAMIMAQRWRDLAAQEPAAAEVMMARLDSRLGKPEEAYKLLDKNKDFIFRNAGEDPEPVGIYCLIIAKAGHADDVRKMLDGGATKGLGYGFAYAAASRALFDDHAKGRAWLTDAPRFMDLSRTRLKLELGKAWFDLAAAQHNDKDDFAKAIAILTPVAADADLGDEAAGYLATAHDNRGELEKAEAFYRQVLKDHPDEPLILNNLAYLLIKRGVTGSEASDAVAFAQRATDLARQRRLSTGVEVSFLDTLGTALRRADRFDDAEDAYRSAVTLAPDNLDILVGLASCLSHQMKEQDVASELNSLMERIKRLSVATAPGPEAQAELERVRQRIAGQQPR